jgi:hypothetical protein
MAASIQIVDANTMFGVHPTHRLDMSVERLVREMDRYRIAAGLSLSTVGIFHDHSMGNAITFEAAKANSRLIPVATVNPRNYYKSTFDVQAICAQGFQIVKFHPTEQEWPINSISFSDVIKQLAEVKLPVMLHASHVGEPSIASQVASEYPAPFIFCSISLDTLSEALAVMERLPNVMIETHELHVPGALEMISERVGADRIVFGSGAPRRSIAGSLHYVLNSELSDGDKERVLGGNIRRVLESA